MTASAPQAIVGIGCRLPGGVASPDAFWELLRDGVDAVTDVPRDRFVDPDTVFDPDPSREGKTYSRWGGYLDDVAGFDAAFFGISPREAARLDPQQRLLLETTQHALDDAGMSSPELRGSRTGVFIGISSHDWADVHFDSRHRAHIDPHTNTGTAISLVANRVSYAFDFRGPSLAVDTACSSSLTALHVALASMRAGESDLAVVGGVQILLTAEPTIGFAKALMLAPDGRCKAFDAAADGYVRSEGVAAVVLKPLERALADLDRIYAVVLGSAINQDGRTNGITVPSREAQERALREALEDAEVDPSEVQYAEAHGTGTAVGDPIEASALGAVIGNGRRRGQAPCLVGSVKTNVGHLEAGAGMAGLIKTALALHHGEVPRSLHFHVPNPAIDFDGLGLRVPVEHQEWPRNGAPATAVINSFGFGGANATAVLQAGPAVAAAAEDAPDTVVFPLSARTPSALREAARAHARYLEHEEPSAVAAAARAAATRRTHYEHRVAVVATAPEVAAGLQAVADEEPTPSVVAGVQPRSQRDLAFVYTGMGPQRPRMGASLLEREPVFRTALERCDELLSPLTGWSVVDELVASPDESRMAEADVAQVTNFALQLALTELWAARGVRPAAVIGHSAGEVAAAWASGGLTLEDAALLAHHRSRLQARGIGRGQMLAVGCNADKAARLVEGASGGISLAAVNGPASTTLSGDADALAEIARECEREGVFARLLPVDVPYHSPVMDEVEEAFRTALRTLTPREGSTPMFSTVTGERLSGKLDSDYWWRNVRHTVRFMDAVRAAAADGAGAFLEVGPHPVLAASLVDSLAHDGAIGLFASLRRNEDDMLAMLRAAAALWVDGRDVSWDTAAAPAPHAKLPLYPFQHERHWFDLPKDAAAVDEPDDDSGHPLLGRRMRSAEHRWRVGLGPDHLGYLDDHLVSGVVPVFAGVGYVEMAFGAARQEGLVPAVTGVDFRQALFLGQRDAVTLEFLLDPTTRRFSIHSGTDAGGGEERWALNCSGRLADASGHPAAIDLEAARARCPVVLSHEEVYSRLRERGLDYRPRFAGIDEAWRGAGEAVGRVRLRHEPIDVTGYEIHPALFDAAAQLLFVAAEAHPSLPHDGRILPIAIDRAEFHSPPGDDFWVVARMTDVGGSWEGAFEITADDGTALVEVDGVHWKWFAVPDTEAREGLLYRHRWHSQPRQPATRVTVPAAAGTERARLDDLRRRVDDAARDAGIGDYYSQVEPHLNAAAAAFAGRALAALGWRPQPGTAVSVDELAAELRVTSERRRLLSSVLSTLEHEGILRAEEPSGWTVVRDLPDVDPQRLLERVESSSATEAALLSRCGLALAEVLRGEVDEYAVLLTGEGMDLLAHFYRDALGPEFANTLVAEAFEAVTSDFPDTGLRILEVGAGTGATTAAILPKLEPGAATYTFTDISPMFAARARDAFSDFTSLEAGTFDLEADPAAQGLSANHDVVIAANVVHATTDVVASLRRIRSLLRPGGFFLLMELTRRVPWHDLVFGVTSGWWCFDDQELRTEHPLLTVGAWEEILSRQFAEVTALHESQSSGDPGLTVFVARAPEHTESHDPLWLVPDATGIAARVARRCEDRGRRCVVADAGRLADPPGRAAVDFRPLDVHGLQAEGVAAAQARACVATTALVPQLSDHGRRSVSIVTAGAVAIDANDPPREPAQAALWGLGRVLASEDTDLDVRLVDLTPDPTGEELDALADELAAPDDETEVALRGSERLVHRLEPVAVADIPARPFASALHAPFRATTRIPGTLDSVRLAPVDRPPLRVDEVELEVRAAGVNFHDVMLALGMLPPRSLHEAPGTGLLGVEAAGVVSRVGSDVRDVRPGDNVVAVAYGAIGSHVTAPAARVRPKPASLSFEQAAAVPIAFVTALEALMNLARVRSGERVLIHAASGGVGLAAVAVAQWLGAEVVATAGNDEKRRFVRSLGVEEVYDSRSLQFAGEILRRSAGRGVDVVLNSLGGAAIEAGISVLAPWGRFIEIGKRDIYDDAPIGLRGFRQNAAYFVLDVDRINLERPEVTGAALGTALEHVASGTWRRPPITTFPMDNVAEALRTMAGARHIGKLVLVPPEGEVELDTSDEDPLCAADGTYVVCGGGSGFGRETVDWLVSEGARNVLVLGRTPRPVQGDLNGSTAQARIEFVRANVTRQADVAAALGRIRQTWPPIRGVVHGAMVLDDGPAGELDETRYLRALEPKVLGAINLDAETRNDDLDFFVLYSSVANLLGSPHQANYAAANAFLDAFAAERRAAGRPVLAAGWGAVSDAGYVARNPRVQAYVERQGIRPFTARAGLAALKRVLRRDLAAVAIARVDWARYRDAWPANGRSPRLAHLAAESSTSAAAEPATGGAIERRLVGETPEETRALLCDYLRSLIGKTLGMPAESIEDTVSLSDLGLDSLIAAEVATVLNTDLGVTIPVVHLLQGVSVAQLAELVEEQLDPARATVTEEGQQVRPAAPEAMDRPPDPVESVVDVGLREPVGSPYADIDEPREAGESNGHRPRAWTGRQLAARRALTAGLCAFVDLDVEGLENVPREGPCILVGNHLSKLDVPVMVSILPRPVVVVSRSSLKRYPWISSFLDYLGHAIWLERGTGDVDAVTACLAELERGSAVALSAEGRRSKTGGLGRGQSGAVYLGRQSGAPVIPGVVWGQEQLAANIRRARRTRVSVRLGEPIRFPRAEASPAELIQETEVLMRSLGALLPSGYRGLYDNRVA